MASRCQSRGHRLLPPPEDIQQLRWWQEEQEASRQGTRGQRPRGSRAQREVPRCFKDRQRHLRGRGRLWLQAGPEAASPGDYVHRAGGTTATLLVGGPHLVLPR
jgi:hypothetical protein